MKRVLLLFSSITILGICLFYYILKNKDTQVGCGTKTPQFICGTENYSEEAQVGKQLFNTNCASCHKLYKKMTGPALSEIAKQYDTITIQNHLKGRETKIKNKGYNSSCLIFRTLSDKDVSNILSYTK